jgi:hypothetical protein
MTNCAADFDLTCSVCRSSKWTARAEVDGKNVCGACLRGQKETGYVRRETDHALWERVRQSAR